MLAKSARLLAPMALAAVAVGVYLVVHSSMATHPHTQAQSTGSVSTPHKPARRRPHPKFYLVKAGDTLSSISVKTHVPIDRLLSLNPLVSPNSLQTGQRLRLRR
ncbi:MAG TPA: LysM domain-containing protein [Solirubrobacteraceae bacterium]|jgi:LysM repeat protein